MASLSGHKFGQRVWVLIQVDASLKDSFYDSFQGLNLNIPLGGGSSEGHQIIDINVQPVEDVAFHQPKNPSVIPAQNLSAGTSVSLSFPVPLRQPTRKKLRQRVKLFCLTRGPPEHWLHTGVFKRFELQKTTGNFSSLTYLDADNSNLSGIDFVWKWPIW